MGVDVTGVGDEPLIGVQWPKDRMVDEMGSEVAFDGSGELDGPIASLFEGGERIGDGSAITCWSQGMGSFVEAAWHLDGSNVSFASSALFRSLGLCWGVHRLFDQGHQMVVGYR